VALTISSPNTDRSLLTAAERRAAAGLAASDTSKDAVLVPLANYVDAMITKACNVAAAGAIPPTLRLESVVETFDFKSAQNGLFLARQPVTEVTAVTEAGSELSSGDWELEGRGLYRSTGSERMTWSVGQVSVSYSAGYSTVPYDLKYAAIKFMQAELNTAGRDPLLRRVSIPDVIDKEFWVDPTKSEIVPAEVLSILERGGFINKWDWMR